MNRPANDDNRTVAELRSGPGRDSAGFASSSAFGHTLPDGMRVGEFEITGLVGEGGFGIVYLAYDHSLHRRVALKEYMPASLATRAADGIGVVVRSQRHAETFQAGLRSFINEARLLAQFDHPALVKVYRFWEANGTAYMAMPYYDGPTLKLSLSCREVPPDEAEIRQWLHPLLDVLQVLHRAKCYHRDIAPDNILLTPSGPLLLDFGAARRVIGDMTHALTVVLKPGYAPIEQYGEIPSMAQGPWTDLYALACVMYAAIMGRPPPPSIERLMDDRMEPISGSAAGRYGEGFLRAIDSALAVQPQQRPQSIEQFRAMLDAGAPQAAVPLAEAAIRRPYKDAETEHRLPLYVLLAAAVAIVGAGFWWWAALQAAREPISVAPSPAPMAETNAPSVAPVPVTVPTVPAPTTEATPVAPPHEAETPQVTAPPRATTEATSEAAADAAARPPEVPDSPIAVPAPAPPEIAKPAPRTRPQPHAAQATPPSLKSRLPERCTDILQKASLEPLTQEEAAFLRRECQ
jgi:hypothetical protein